MTRRRVIDIVSKKKSDTMVGLNTTLVPGERTYYAEFANGFNVMLWSPTARYKAGYGGDSESVRSADTVYWKGIAEKLHIESDTSDPWSWRRIVFEYQASFDVDDIPPDKYFAHEEDITGVNPTVTTLPDLTNPTGLAGIERTNRPMEPLNTTEYQFLWNRIFKGQRFVDWLDPRTARVETREIKVHSDVTRMMKSGNDSAIYKDYSVFIPLNKTMSYNGEESGALETSGAYADQKSPLGNVFIMDLFAQPSAAPATLSVAVTATAYWHEK